MKVSSIALISKEGHGEAREVAKDMAKNLLEESMSVTCFPNLHLKGADHMASLADLNGQKFDLIVTVSGDGTILRVIRALDYSIPFLCVNVGGRGILAEIKPDQTNIAIAKIRTGNFRLEKRIRLLATVESKAELAPSLNEICVSRQSLTRTPTFTIDLGGSVFSQRMDGLMVTTPTGSTGHSYSYGSPFIEGNLNLFLLTPLGSIRGFPKIVRDDSPFRVMANYSLEVIVDGQETTNVEANTYINFKRHEKDAVFVRFDVDSPFRQLRNLGFD